MENLRTEIDLAKQAGCIGLVVEIVANRDCGRVILPAELERIGRVCEEKQLLLAVDETLTAIRCGAPFAFQRPEYQDCAFPDLVFFGKGLVAQGTAVNFGGTFLRKFAIQTLEHKR
jgi:adenosylmethionine-8-amino-7-oxononanoate aminotransferase